VKKNKSGNGTTNWKLWLGLLLSALFLYLAFKDIDLKMTWSHIRSARFFPLLLVISTIFFQHITRAWRWKILLDPIKQTGFQNRFLTILIGFGGNCVLPVRLGELIRGIYLGKRENMSISSALGTIVVERLLDGFMILIILLIGLISVDYHQEWGKISTALQTSGYVFFFTFILLVFFFIGLKLKTKYFLNLLDGLLFFLPRRLRDKAVDIAHNFSLGLVLLKTPSSWLWSIFYSALIWLLALFQVMWIGQALNIDIPSLSTTLLLMFAVIGVAIPSAPGFVGTFHLSTQYGFILFGLAREKALSAAILWHAGVILPNAVFGVIAFFVAYLSMRKTGQPPTEKSDS